MTELEAKQRGTANLIGPQFVEDLLRWKRTMMEDYESRIQRLERAVEMLGPKEVRYATTVGYNTETETEDSGSYPAATANTFWCKLGAPSYTEAAGNQTLTVTPYDPAEYRLVHSPTGSYVAEGTNIRIFLIHGQYYMCEGSIELFIFKLKGSFSSGSATADILEMDETDTLIDATVLDPLGVFADLTTDDTGYCLYQAGSYYAIQAPCPVV